MMMHTWDLVLCRRLAQCQINGTSHGTPVEPAIGIDTDCLSSEFLHIARLVDRFQQGQQTCNLINASSVYSLTETHR